MRGLAAAACDQPGEGQSVPERPSESDGGAVMHIDHEIEGLKEVYAESHMIVIIPCRGREVSAGMIKITDVIEGFMGEDIVTYECPVCGLEHKSAVYRK
jgi:hypothetical protein